MKHFYFLLVLGFLMLGSIIPIHANQSSGDQHASRRIPVIIRMKDQLDTKTYVQTKLAGYSAPVKRSKLIGSLKNYHAQSQEPLLKLLKNRESSQIISNIKQFWITNIITCEATDEAIEEIKARNDVESVNPDLEQKVIEGESTSEVLANEDSNVAYNIAMVRALEANSYGYTGKGVIVALIDTGVNTDHEDLKDALWSSQSYPNHGWNFTYNNDNIKDDNGHGTHCAGTILGNGKSGTRTGVAPDAKLMVLRVIDGGGNSTQSSVIRAVEFAAEQGANVISMSLGFLGTSNSERKIWRDTMTNLLEFNLLAVIAAGNEGEYASIYKIPYNLRFPGACPPAWLHPEQTLKGGTSSVITVGAVTQKGDTRLALSSMGPVTWKGIDTYDDYHYNPEMGLIKPDIMAAGQQVVSTDINNTKGYTAKNGTSMATPCVAGIVAAILSKNPDLKPAEIVQIISESSIKLSPTFNNQTGAGRADALLATLYAPNPGMNCKSITIKETAGYSNGYLNLGDEANLSFTFENQLEENISDYEMEIKCLSPQATVSLNELQLPVIRKGENTTVSSACHIKLLPEATIGDLIDIAIIIRKDDKVWTNLFRIPISYTMLEKEELQLKELEGNGNGKADAGEKVELIFPVKNIGTEPCMKVSVSQETSTPHLSFTETANPTFEKIDGTENIKLTCSISKEIPNWYTPKITLKFKGENIDTIFTYKIQIGKQGILIVDKSKNKLSSKAVTAYLDSKNYSYTESEKLSIELDKIKGNHSIWIFAGVYPNANSLTAGESKVLTYYLDEGGYLYMEGGDLWFDNQLTSVNAYFNIDPLNHNGGKLSDIVGCMPGYNESYSQKYTYSNISVDRIAPIEPAFALYKNQDPEYFTTVAHDAGKYRTIGSSFELGGILSGTETSPILDSFLDFFQMVEGGHFVTSISKEKTVEKLQTTCYKYGKECLVNISVPGCLSTVVSLYNSNGQLIHQVKENITDFATVRIPVTDFTGIYFIKVNAGGETIAKKVLF